MKEDSSLVADANHAQARRKQFFDQVVFFVVQRRSAQVRDGLRLHQNVAIFLFDKRAFTTVPQSISHHIHRCVEIEFFPFCRPGSPIADFLQAIRMRSQFEAVRGLWA